MKSSLEALGDQGARNGLAQVATILAVVSLWAISVMYYQHGQAGSAAAVQEKILLQAALAPDDPTLH